jgi:hypothetical protein
LGKTPVNAVTEDSIQKDLSEQGTDNFLINGGFDFWQRNTSFTASGYTADRWYATFYTSVTLTQLTSGLPSNRSKFGLKWTTGGAGSYIILNHCLEQRDVIALRDRRVNFSFWAKSATGNFSSTLLAYVQYDSATDSRSSVATVVPGAPSPSSPLAQSLSTTWKLFSFSFVVPSNALGLKFSIDCNSMQASGVEVDIADAMLNIGTKAAPFKRAGNTIGWELALCQRYYCKSFNIDVPAAQNSGSSSSAISYRTLLGGVNYHTLSIKFPVSMRAVPNPVTFYSINTATDKWSNLSTELDSASGSYTQE